MQSFAGGFTLGVAQAGFTVVAKRELPGGFGVPSVQVNVDHVNPGLEIQVGADHDWAPVDDLPFLFGNPPCSGFSGVSDNAFAGVDAKINSCMWSLVEYAARCRGADGRLGPEVIAYESVQNAYAKGLTLLRALHARLEELTGAEYTLHHVLHNGLALGGAAERRRYFWVAARVPFGLAPYPLERTPTLWDVIADLSGIAYDSIAPTPYAYGPTWWSADKRDPSGLVEGHLAMAPQYQRQSQALLDTADGWRCGESLSKALRRYYDAHGTFPCMTSERDEAFARHYGPEDRDFNFGGAWQPERWHADRPARVVTGGSAARSIHPTEPRPLTLREMYRIQGFPDTWRIGEAVALASVNTAALWPGKGIPVQSGRWLASEVRAALEGTPHDDGRTLQIGEREMVWNGTADARPRKPIAAKRQAKVTTTTRETKMTKVPQAIGVNDPEVIRRELLDTGRATVQLAGLDAKEAKKAKELLYGAAYAAGRKVKVRTDKATDTAIGELLDAAHAPQTRAKPAAQAPAPTATSNALVHEWPDGTTFVYDGLFNEWRQTHGPRPVPVRSVALLALAPGDTICRDRSEAIVRAVDLANDVVRVTTTDDVFEGAYGDLVSLSAVAVDDAGRAALVHARTAVAAPPPAQTEVSELELDDPLVFEPEPALAEAKAEAVPPPPPPEQTHRLQPKTSKREVKDRRYDLTQLRAGSHGYYVHRDYASHYFRWGWASRHCTPTTRLLDLGSGQDLALARVLIYHNGIPQSMVAVDLNKLQGHVQPKWLTVYDETNVCDAATRAEMIRNHPERFNLVTAFEIIEHMPPEDGDALLLAIRDLLSDDGYALLSTPVFNGRAAANHIHEYTIEELQRAIERAGLRVVDRFGTFASYHDVRKGLADWATARFSGATDDGGIAAETVRLSLEAFYERCREFYSDDVMANFMAPALPDYARNNAWKLTRA